VKKFADEGGAIYAECGGLMYLAHKIVTRDGTAFPMASILSLSVQMTDRLVKFGYTEVCLTADCLWGSAGARARGHSFHCSTITESGPMDQTYKASYTLARREEAEGFNIKNVLASYIHLHFLSCPGLATTFVENVQRANRLRKKPTMLTS
jgi:cobyrinic acid a,c-diamide synthase